MLTLLFPEPVGPITLQAHWCQWEETSVNVLNGIRNDNWL